MTRRWMLDFDGVIADLQGALVRSCNERFQTHFTVESVTDWNWWFRQPKQFADYVWKQCYQDTDWLLDTVEIYPDVLDAFDALSERGDSVLIVTARQEQHAERVRHWLLTHGGIPRDVYFVGRDPKSGYCHKLNLDTVVEDGAHNLRAMNPDKQTLFIVDRPWNRQEVLPGVTRVSGLLEAVEMTA